MSRVVIRIILIISFALSLSVIAFAIISPVPQDQAVWATIAAALAVITSVFSAWTAQRVLEIEEDTQKPFPYPSFDISSRLGLVQLRITNYGGTSAREINLVWDKPLLNLKGEKVRFSGGEGIADIPVLLPNDSVAVLVNSPTSIFQEGSDFETSYSGRIEFEDASGRSSSHPFFISLEQYRHSLTYDSEKPKTLRELQKVPEELKKIRELLERR